MIPTTKQLAAELGCSEQTFQNWRRQDEADRGERADVLTSAERARLRELERENKVLRVNSNSNSIEPGHPEFESQGQAWARVEL